MIKNNKKPSKEILEKWAEMTDNNEHGEVRLSIAEWMVDYNYIAYFRKYILIRDSEQEISNEYFDEYCKKTNNMLDDIEKEYGKEISNKINNCL